MKMEHFIAENTAIPIKPSERYAILDILRGLALLGIVFANFPEFGLYTFLKSDAAADSVLYTVSVFPLGFAYVAATCLLYLRHPEAGMFKFLSAPGRMALTNYIGQSLWGMVLFYGIGLGFGADTGLIYILFAATCVFFVEALFSYVWLIKFRFGPLEWIWRMLTYGKYFRISNK